MIHVLSSSLFLSQFVLLRLLLPLLNVAGKYSNAESKIVVDAVKEYAAINSVSVEVRYLMYLT